MEILTYLKKLLHKKRLTKEEIDDDYKFGINILKRKALIDGCYKEVIDCPIVFFVSRELSQKKLCKRFWHLTIESSQGYCKNNNLLEAIYCWSSLSKVFVCCFWWEDTKEGYRFWKRIYKELKSKWEKLEK